MYGMMLGDFHSYRDFSLVPTSKPVISLPEPRLEYLSIPGKQGNLDITESLSSEVIYDMRKGFMEFLIADNKKWTQIYQKLKSQVHGKKLSIILDTEPSFYYMGRVSISDIKSDKNYQTIVFDYTLEPYKYSVEDKKRNGHHFLEKIIVKGDQKLIIPFDSDMTIVPEFTEVKGKIYVLFGSRVYGPIREMMRFPEIRAREDLYLAFQGEGELAVSYQRGWL